MTFSALLDDEGQVRDSKVCMGWVKNPRVVTYGAVDEALGIPRRFAVHPFGSPAGGEEPSNPRSAVSVDSGDLDDLRTLRDLALRQRSHRLANAGLDWALPTASIRLGSHASPNRNFFDLVELPSHSAPTPDFLDIEYSVPVVSPTPDTSLPATAIVAEMMILAGRIAAQYCTERGIPVPYRGSETPKPVSLPGQQAMTLEDLLALRDPSGRIDPFFILGANITQPKSTLSLEPASHWVMGFADPKGGYIRATSPLRRFEDLLVHWQLKSALASEHGITTANLVKPLTREEVETLSLRAEAGFKLAKRASVNSSAFWRAGLIASRLTGTLPPRWNIKPEEAVDLRESITAKVAGMPVTQFNGAKDTSTPVYLPRLGAMVRMTSSASRKLAIGEEVQVKVEKAVQWPSPMISVREA
jgi:hypothetical protein